MLGYRTTAEPDVQRWGPQPYEGRLSVLLQEFPAYTVAELERADWLTLSRILDYRRAQDAIRLFNGGAKGFEELSKREDLTTILLELGRAQAGQDVELGQMLAAKRAEWKDEDED